MKFGKFLLASRVRDWEEYYVDYKKLCKCIKTEKAAREQEQLARELETERESESARRDQPSHSLEDEEEGGTRQPLLQPLLPHEPVAREPTLEVGEVPLAFSAEFFDQIENLNVLFSKKREDLHTRYYGEIKPEADKHGEGHGPGGSLPRVGSSKSLLHGDMDKLRQVGLVSIDLLLRDIYKDCMTLKQVCDLNVQGLSKALKKYKKSFKKDKGKEKEKEKEKEKNKPETPTLVRTNERVTSTRHTSSSRRIANLFPLNEHENLERTEGTDIEASEFVAADPAPFRRSRSAIDPPAASPGELSRRSSEWVRLPSLSSFLAPREAIPPPPSPPPPQVPQVDLKEQAFYQEVKEVEQIADSVEICYSCLFTGGDRKAATRKLRHVHRAGLERHFRLGFSLGCCVCTLFFLFWFAAYEPAKDECPFCASSFESIVPVYRVMFLPILWLWCWSGLCFVWKELSVNYIFIMSINPTTELGYDRCARVAAYMTLSLLLNFCLFVAAVRTGYQPLGIPFHLYPMALLLFGVFCLLAPKGTFYYKSRRYFFSSLCRIVIAPFGPEVRFVDNYTADVLTSLAVFLRDVDYSLQFYATGAYLDPTKEVELNKVYWVSAPLITALPYWFRLQQCVRRFYDAGSGHPQRTVHLLNAGKYATSLAATCIAALGNYTQLNFDEMGSWDGGKIAWFTVLVLSTVYAYVWDVTMDWGFVERFPEAPWWRRYRMRGERIYPSVWVYYAAAVLNLLGRLAWALTITPHSLLKGVPRSISTTTIAVVELLRRTQWSLFRLEYEYTANPSNYRSVKEVPMMLNTEGYQEAAEKDKKKRPSVTAILVGAANSTLTLVILMVIYYYRTQDDSPTPTPPP